MLNCGKFNICISINTAYLIMCVSDSAIELHFVYVLCLLVCVYVFLTDHDLIVDLSQSESGSSVISNDLVHLDVCKGTALTTNFTCKVEGKPENVHLPRICVQQSNDLSCISPRNSMGLKNENIVILQISQNFLRFQQMSTETEVARNMQIYCKLDNISSNRIEYRVGMLCKCVCTVR